jgi:hypothetical protein
MSSDDVHQNSLTWALPFFFHALLCDTIVEEPSQSTREIDLFA